MMQELKHELLILLAGTNRGLNIGEKTRKALMSTLELLEVLRHQPQYNC